MNIALIIILVVVVILVVAFWTTYNSLVKLDERVNEAWSDITVQLKYRADLIPNVVETVQGYAKHEKGAFEEIAKARSATMSAKTVNGAAEAERSMQSALGRLFAIAESYPELKANTNFQQLQMFPTNLINSMIGHFKPRDYFEVPDEERTKIEKAPEVKFS